MGVKDFLFGQTKGADCIEDEQGNKYCRAMVRHRNSKLATGSEWSYAVDPQSCKAHLTGSKNSIFDDDEEIVRKTMKRAEADCRGG
jgi:hypothetical protein